MTARTVAPASTLHALVAGVVDYAGLFPPAALGMDEAVAGYATYRASPDAWMLGRFVVPTARLDELSAAAARHTAARSAAWRLSVLVSDDIPADAARINAFNAAHTGRLVVDVAELRASSVAALEPAIHALGAELTTFVELPVADEPREWLGALKRAGARAKVRTGGITAGAFPITAQLARFIVRCAEAGVPFKATAGLHHPLRGEQKLTYEPDAPSGTMFGFLNVFLAGAFALGGMSEHDVARLLEERDAGAMTFGHESVRWREHTLTLDQLRHARTSFALAFGSCSFREPVDDLRHLALL
ncbi:MAG: hypothetical protein M3Z10_13145 [Gemmatimonadota bacterium]|nr:hypothetical protein [Gemmatimonadota bacterium]